MSPSPGDTMLVYRMDLSEATPSSTSADNTSFFLATPTQFVRYFPSWVRSMGWAEATKTALKVLSGKRLFFGTLQEGRVIQSGWANLGFCRHYSIEPDAVVLGAVWTDSAYRGRGLAPAAIRRAIGYLSERNYRRFYVDTTVANKASQRMIEKTGFLPLASSENDRSSV